MLLKTCSSSNQHLTLTRLKAVTTGEHGQKLTKFEFSMGLLEALFFPIRPLSFSKTKLICSNGPFSSWPTETWDQSLNPTVNWRSCTHIHILSLLWLKHMNFRISLPSWARSSVWVPLNVVFHQENDCGPAWWGSSTAACSIFPHNCRIYFIVTGARAVEFQYAIHQVLHYWISWMWHHYRCTFMPIIDRGVPSISQLMQVSWIDQSSDEFEPQSIYSYGSVLLISMFYSCA